MAGGLQGLLAIVGDLVVVTVARQQVLEKQQVGGDILGRQDAQPGRRRQGRRGGGHRLVAGDEGTGTFESEGRAGRG